MPTVAHKRTQRAKTVAVSKAENKNTPRPKARKEEPLQPQNPLFEKAKKYMGVVEGPGNLSTSKLQ